MLGISIAIGSISAIVGLVGVMLAWLRDRRRRVLVSISAQKVTHVGSLTDLGITYRGNAVDDPHIVVCRIVNESRRDITTKDFDASRALIIKINVPIIGGGEASDSDFAVKDGSVELSPQLVKRKSSLETSIVTEGEPLIGPSIVASPLIDTELKVVDTRSDSRASGASLQLKMMAGVLVALMGLAVSAIFLAHSSADRDRSDTELRQSIIDSDREYQKSIDDAHSIIDSQQRTIDDLRQEILVRLPAVTARPGGG